MVGCAVKLGDGPFEPLILLAIVGPVPKKSVYLKNERENLTEEQKRLMKQIAEEYKHE